MLAECTLLLLLFCITRAQVVPFTAKDAYAATSRTVANHGGPDFVNAVYREIRALTAQSHDYCYTHHVQHEYHQAELQRIWPFAKVQFEVDGYRIKEVYLREEDDADAELYYKDTRDANGRIIQQEQACTRGATIMSYNSQSHLSRCVQKARLTLCWDGHSLLDKEVKAIA